LELLGSDELEDELVAAEVVVVSLEVVASELVIAVGVSAVCVVVEVVCWATATSARPSNTINMAAAKLFNQLIFSLI
jgi:hypothetical protein